MAYRLERGESVLHGLRRVVRDEIESAGAKLAGNHPIGRDKAIHETRKSIKKVRALLRLVSEEMHGVEPRENRRLRDIARRLSRYRDAFVMVETFDDLRRKFRTETFRKLSRTRARLIDRRNTTRKEQDVVIVVEHAAAALSHVAQRVSHWTLDAEGYAAIGPGLERTFRAGRAALAVVREDPRAENFHDLRKRVKDHWYHVRLLENLWTDLMAGYEKSLRNVETWLGNDHNLAVLRDMLLADPESYGAPEEIELMFDLIDRYQKELREQAVSLAERIYEEKPAEFTRRMHHLWDTWRQHPKLKSPTAA